MIDTFYCYTRFDLNSIIIILILTLSTHLDNKKPQHELLPKSIQPEKWDPIHQTTRSVTECTVVGRLKHYPGGYNMRNTHMYSGQEEAQPETRYLFIRYIRVRLSEVVLRYTTTPVDHKTNGIAHHVVDGGRFAS